MRSERFKVSLVNVIKYMILLFVTIYLIKSSAHGNENYFFIDFLERITRSSGASEKRVKRKSYM